MSLVLWHVGLAWLWTALTERLTASNFLVGALAAHLALRLARGRGASVRKTGLALGFLAYLAREILRSALRVSRDVFLPRGRMRPALVEVPLDVRGDGEITLLAVVVTLTPGTLALDVSPDRRRMLVHAMFGADAERVRREIKGGFERRILELTA